MGKVYLGDGVYVEDYENMIKLTTSNGIYDTNIIFLEHSVYEDLKKWYEKEYL
jgi:hypothetical protein